MVEGCGNASFHGECVGVCGCECGECDVCLTVTRGERPGSGVGERERRMTQSFCDVHVESERSLIHTHLKSPY